MKIYVDLDGVLADFAAHYAASFGVKTSLALDNVDWAKVKAVPGFYRNIPPTADAAELWAAIVKYGPTVLTGVPKVIPEAAGDKIAWVAANYGANIPVICCASKEKSAYAKGAVLIDDWVKYKPLWEAAGGTWITHTSAAATIKELEALDL